MDNSGKALSRLPCDGYQVYAVPVARAIRQVVAQVTSRQTHRLAVAKHTHVLPHRLLVTKTRPTVALALTDELVHRTSDGRAEERLACDGVVERDGTFLLKVVAFEVLHELRRFPVPRTFGPVPVEGDDAVSGGTVDVPPQVRLHGRLRGSVRLLRHDRLFPSHERRVTSRRRRTHRTYGSERNRRRDDNEAGRQQSRTTAREEPRPTPTGRRRRRKETRRARRGRRKETRRARASNANAAAAAEHRLLLM
mmetsp:Transcript_9467/g.21466  ORF Transcript_9467/g.21466 Transcript_9467/m.21466 type:complete len:251 (-) Transcript_9467:52-804(-)